MNKLKILTLLCIAASLSPVLGFGKKTESGKKYPSFYSTGIKVDGNPAEWPSKILFCNFDAKVYYGAANDSNHLYFCVEILNSAEQMKIMRNGLEIWINPEGKKKKTSLVNVTFGSGNKPGEPGDNRMRPPTGGPGSNQMKPPQGDSLPPSILKGNPPKKQGKMMPRQRAFSFPGNITTEGFRDGFNSTWIPGKGKDDFSAFFAYDSTGALILEVRVPVNAFQIDPRNSDCVAMGFEITSMGGGMGQGG
ncbi:MAG: hypothetical protein Q8867_10185, partial [Bacteroidota bacterium]|nr:hypothetical protein [Bacteroidota bacterium]